MHSQATKCMPRAVIIGMMAAGKTRVGKEVAHMMGMPFLDADIEIEREIGMSIPDFFAKYSEREFREVEADVIEDVLGRHSGIFSLGGGAPMTKRVRDMLEVYKQSGGNVVYLMADPKEAMERARRGGGRPMLDGDADARWMQLYVQRDPVFMKVSNRKVGTHGLTPNQAAKKVKQMIEQRVVPVVSQGVEPYNVCIGEGVLAQLAQSVGERAVKVALIHTGPVQRHSDHARTLLRQAGYDVYDIAIPDAEAGKTIQVVNSVWTRLATAGFTRSDAIVGIGGGAATDVAGFIAATWMRGIRYVNCPTSLLAMVDASTGGKTGINTPEGKNLVGSFYTPAAVLADTRTLSTLPNDIFIEGLGEVAKSGFIYDPEILHILEQNAERLRNFDGSMLQDDEELRDIVTELIERTVRVKVRHVSQDLTEQGMREYLNYGHTLGHAIEQMEHFKWRHGNAVAVGMVFAARLSRNLGLIDDEYVSYHERLLSSLGLPVRWHGDFETALALMHKDKKARGKHMRFVLLDEHKAMISVTDPDLDAVKDAFAYISESLEK